MLSADEIGLEPLLPHLRYIAADNEGPGYNFKRPEWIDTDQLGNFIR